MTKETKFGKIWSHCKIHLIHFARFFRITEHFNSSNNSTCSKTFYRDNRRPPRSRQNNSSLPTWTAQAWPTTSVWSTWRASIAIATWTLMYSLLQKKGTLFRCELNEKLFYFDRMPLTKTAKVYSFCNKIVFWSERKPSRSGLGWPIFKICCQFARASRGSEFKPVNPQNW